MGSGIIFVNINTIFKSIFNNYSTHWLWYSVNGNHTGKPIDTEAANEVTDESENPDNEYDHDNNEHTTDNDDNTKETEFVSISPNRTIGNIPINKK